MSDSEDDKPLAQRARPTDDSEDDEDDVPLASRQASHKPGADVTAATNGHQDNGKANGSIPTAGTSRPAVASGYDDESSSDDDVPLGAFITGQGWSAPTNPNVMLMLTSCECSATQEGCSSAKASISSAQKGQTCCNGY